MIKTVIIREYGNVESSLMMLPIMSVVILLFGLISYGGQVNSLNLRAELLARAVARNAQTNNLDRSLEYLLLKEKIKVHNAQVLKVRIGDKNFINVHLKGEQITFGPFKLEPQGRGLAFVSTN